MTPSPQGAQILSILPVLALPGSVTLSHVLPLQVRAFCHQCPPAQTPRVLLLSRPSGSHSVAWFSCDTLLPSPIPTSFPKYMNSLHVHPGKATSALPPRHPELERGQHSHRSHHYLLCFLIPSFKYLFLILLLLAKTK